MTSFRIDANSVAPSGLQIPSVGFDRLIASEPGTLWLLGLRSLR